MNEMRGRARVVVAVAPGGCVDAVDTAFGVAAERGLPVLAVRAWHDSDVPLGGWVRPHGTTRWDTLHQRARNDLDRAVEQAKAAHPTVEVATVVVDDDPVQFLTALTTGAELLVLGRPRHRGQHASPVDVLVRQAACPVLVVPPTGRRPSPRPGVVTVPENGASESSGP